MVIATTRPARQPIEMNDTASTMTSASISASANSLIASVTTAGWSEICSTETPTGSVASKCGKRRVDVLADGRDVEALRHDDADLDRVLAVEAVLAA